MTYVLYMKQNILIDDLIHLIIFFMSPFMCFHLKCGIPVPLKKKRGWNFGAFQIKQCPKCSLRRDWIFLVLDGGGASLLKDEEEEEEEEGACVHMSRHTFSSPRIMLWKICCYRFEP